VTTPPPTPAPISKPIIYAGRRVVEESIVGVIDALDPSGRRLGRVLQPRSDLKALGRSFDWSFPGERGPLALALALAADRITPITMDQCPSCGTWVGRCRRCPRCGHDVHVARHVEALLVAPILRTSLIAGLPLRNWTLPATTLDVAIAEARAQVTLEPAAPPPSRPSQSV
jgi:ribosomal protein L32